jgi:hypothetical protein
VEIEEHGYAMVDGVRLPIVGLHMCGGLISLSALVPPGYPGCTDAVVTLFGHDDRGIFQAPNTVSIPPLPADLPYGTLEIEMGTL